MCKEPVLRLLAIHSKEIIIYVLVKDCATEPGRNVLSPAYGTLASKVESFFASKDSDDSVASKHHYI